MAHSGFVHDLGSIYKSQGDEVSWVTKKYKGRAQIRLCLLRIKLNNGKRFGLKVY